MSEKSQRLAELLAKVPPPPTPLPSVEGKTLLEIGFLCVLYRRLSESAAEKTLTALVAAYPDWNELRVSQAQEFKHLICTRNNDLALKVTRDIREFLQEVYQKVHGFNLDVIKGDLAEAARFASNLPFLGASAGHYLMMLACPDDLPASPAIVRTLDRLGLIKRTSSIKKAQASIGAIVPDAMRRDFTIRAGYVVEKWCDAKKPLCWECPLVQSCPHGKKVEREWKQAQKRLELQRARDEERTKKELEKERRRAAAEEKRRIVAKAKENARRVREAARVKAKATKAAKVAKVEKAKTAKTKGSKVSKGVKAAKTTNVGKTAKASKGARVAKASKGAKGGSVEGRSRKKSVPMKSLQEKSLHRAGGVKSSAEKAKASKAPSPRASKKGAAKKSLPRKTKTSKPEGKVKKKTR